MLEEAATDRAQSRYVQWETPGLPAVVIRRNVADGILKEVLHAFNAVPRRGAETGGLLLGNRVREQIRVEDFEPVPCEHRFGPSYLLSDSDRAALEETLGWFRAGPRHGLSVVGFYRSHTRPDFALHAEDGALFSGYFADPSQAFLLIKPNRWQESVADFYFWRDGELRQALHLDTFPFTQGCDLERIPEAAPEPPPATLAPVVPQAARPSWQRIETPAATVQEFVSPPPPAPPAPRQLQADLSATTIRESISPPPPAVPAPRPQQTEPSAAKVREAASRPPDLDDELPPLPRTALAQERSHRWSWGAVAALALILTGAFIYAPQRRGASSPAPPAETQAATPGPATPEPAPNTPPPADAQAEQPAQTAAAEPSPAAEPEKPAEPPPEPELSTHQEIDSVLNQWSGSIRRGDLYGAISCYAPRISPYFKKRNARPVDVRKRLDYQRGRYGKLAVHSIRDLSVTELTAKTAVATFVRHWETAGAKKLAGEERQRMKLVRTGAGWKIASEEQARIY